MAEVDRNKNNGSDPRGNTTYRDSDQTLNDLTNPVGSVVYNAYGNGGSLRHTGNFYTNNPYLDDLKVARDNQDIDALYERAVEWDADWFNLQEQRAYDKAVLDEQRDYDSPVNQIARQRAAGINPDIAGSGSGSGSSSGSSAQMTPRQIADQQGQTKFSNKYDNLNNVFNGINAGANVLSSVVGAYGAIADSVMKFKSLPSQIALNNSTAKLNTTKADEISQLLSGKKTGQALDNGLKFVNLIGSLGNMIKPDASDEEFAALVEQAGIEEASRPGYISAIKQAQSQPGFLSNYKSDILSERDAEAQLQVYTQEALLGIHEEELQLQELQLDFDIMRQGIQNSVMTYLTNSPGYTENLADIQSLTADNAANSLELAKDQLRRDFAAYGQGLEHLVKGVENLRARNAELEQLRDGRKDKRLNTVEQLEYDTNLLRISQMEALGSQNIAQVYSILHDARRQKFYLESAGGYNKEKGTLTPPIGKSVFDDYTLVFGQIGFGDVLNGQYTTTQLAQEWSKIALQVLSIGAQVYTGYRLGNIGQQSSSITTKFKQGNGKMIPTETTVVTDKVPTNMRF